MKNHNIKIQGQFFLEFFADQSSLAPYSNQLEVRGHFTCVPGRYRFPGVLLDYGFQHGVIRFNWLYKVNIKPSVVEVI